VRIARRWSRWRRSTARRRDAALGKFFREEGLYTFVRWNYFFTNPPLCITEGVMQEHFWPRVRASPV
jgi:hypothetical protein